MSIPSSSVLVQMMQALPSPAIESSAAFRISGDKEEWWTKRWDTLPRSARPACSASALLFTKTSAFLADTIRAMASIRFCSSSSR
ncbi:MAG: hypothetical protein A4E42_00540 [Methanoregulaceae archaeon PtaU1.Bin222]|nr:MAG: hypothetical protein A4E42_00540 [Methanoregulaceae archaeon PtaU1.Bin222]